MLCTMCYTVYPSHSNTKNLGVLQQPQAPNYLWPCSSNAIAITRRHLTVYAVTVKFSGCSSYISINKSLALNTASLEAERINSLPAASVFRTLDGTLVNHDDNYWRQLASKADNKFLCMSCYNIKSLKLNT